ncbi:RWD domain-containing protein [Schizosaccharomyces pombe]
MTSAIEEEREILESIYPEEFKCINDNTFEITQPIDREESNCDNPPSLIFTCQLSEAYPDEVPDVKITFSEPHPWLGEEEIERLKQVVAQNAEECLGMAMIFSLCSVAKEETNAILIEQSQRETQAIEERHRKEAEQENKKFHGTPVTVESFTEWKKGFDAWRNEQLKLEQESKLKEALSAASSSNARKAILEKRMTGRELFENNLVKLDDVEGEA